jgi:hypothetical protein
VGALVGLPLEHAVRARVNAIGARLFMQHLLGTQSGCGGKTAEYRTAPNHRNHAPPQEIKVDMVGIEQRHQDVHVEQSDPAHGSSRSRVTNSIVGRGLP